MSGNFSQALSVCRLQQPGRVNRRVHLPPTHPRVAACLERNGWLPNGTPVRGTVGSSRATATSRTIARVNAKMEHS